WKQGATDPATKNLLAGDIIHAGGALYYVRFTAAECDTLGELGYVVTYVDCMDYEGAVQITETGSSAPAPIPYAGSVTNAIGAVIAGVTVFVSQTEGDAPIATVATDSHGDFTLYLVPGSYYLRLQHTSYTDSIGSHAITVMDSDTTHMFSMDAVISGTEYPTTALLRRLIRDTSVTYAFSNDELNNCIANAIYAYSKRIPREVKGSLNLVVGQADYPAPENLIELVSIDAGGVTYSITDIFAGEMTLSPTPTTSGAAVLKYKGCHTIPSESQTISSYDSMDEPLIMKHAMAQCWEILAGDGARYYEYTEGDVKENQGKTQAQFRAEADKLYGEFSTDLAESAKAKLAGQPVSGTTHTMAAKVSRKKTPASTTIYKD
ncbi:carboxypeptidase-like regulatory domain-containing protein, partial [bacterium]|nr:carboxypeptidase-like regulatory domain-containing protein [bacterium]